jgi:hypothetical protein
VGSALCNGLQHLLSACQFEQYAPLQETTLPVTQFLRLHRLLTVNGWYAALEVAQTAAVPGHTPLQDKKLPKP